MIRQAERAGAVAPTAEPSHLFPGPIELGHEVLFHNCREKSSLFLNSKLASSSLVRSHPQRNLGDQSRIAFYHHPSLALKLGGSEPWYMGLSRFAITYRPPQIHDVLDSL